MIQIEDLTFCPFCTEFVYLGCLHFDNGSTINIDHVPIEHVVLSHILPLAVHLKFDKKKGPLLELILICLGFGPGVSETMGLGTGLDNSHFGNT